MFRKLKSFFITEVSVDILSAMILSNINYYTEYK